MRYNCRGPKRGVGGDPMNASQLQLAPYPSSKAIKQ